MSTMVRLNAQIRDETIRNLLNFKFAKEKAELDKKEEEMEQAQRECKKLAYEACFSKSQREKMEALPAGWLPESKGCKIRIEDKDDPENYNDVFAWFSETSEGRRRVPNKLMMGDQFAAVIKSDHPYAVMLAKAKDLQADHDAMREDYHEKRSAARVKAMRVIDSVTTVKRLLEIWPQVQEFLPEMVSGQGGGVPAYLVEDLNKEFGL